MDSPAVEKRFRPRVRSTIAVDMVGPQKTIILFIIESGHLALLKEKE